MLSDYAEYHINVATLKTTYLWPLSHSVETTFAVAIAICDLTKTQVHVDWLVPHHPGKKRVLLLTLVTRKYVSYLPPTERMQRQHLRLSNTTLPDSHTAWERKGPWLKSIFSYSRSPCALFPEKGFSSVSTLNWRRQILLWEKASEDRPFTDCPVLRYCLALSRKVGNKLLKSWCCSTSSALVLKPSFS